jgi:hypothetical protein
MEKITLLLAIALYSPPSFAKDHFGRLLESLNKANHQIHPSSSQFCMSDTNVGVSTQELEKSLSACATQICGKAKRRNFADEFRRKALGLIEGDTEFLKQVVSSMKRKVEAEKVKVQILENLLRSPWRIHLDSSYYPAANFVRQLLSDAIPVVKYERGKISVDRDATKKKFKALPLALREKFLAFDELFYESSAYLDAVQRLQLPIEIYMRNRYPNLSFEEALKLDAEGIKKTLETLKKNPSFRIWTKLIKSFDSNEEQKRVEALASGEHLSPDDLESYNKSMVEFTFGSEILLHPESYGSLLSSLLEPIETFIKNSDIEKKVAAYKGVILKLEKALNEGDWSNTNLVGTYFGMQGAYEAQISIAPTNEDIATVGEELVRKAKEQIRQKFLPHFSKKSQAILNSAIDSIKFKFPKTRDQIIHSVKSRFEALDKANSEYINKNMKRPVSMYNSEDLLEFYSYSRWTAQELFKDLEEAIGKVNLCPFEDQAYRDYFGIEVSAASLKGPESGLFVLKHEIGHLLMNALKTSEISEESKAIFGKIGECLDKRYQEEPNYKRNHYLSEDWADLVSGSTFENESLNGACALLSKTERDSVTKYEVGLNSNTDSDPHSAALFRVLHVEQLMKGKLPPKCEKALDLLSTPPDFSSCLELSDSIQDSNL